VNKLLKAAKDKYKAKKSEALAHLDILFNKPVGIGEHTDIMAEIEKWVDVVAQSEENLNILIEHFDEYGDVKTGFKDE
tara:strand:- start:666 stop:899 length:234 start_codon:yes stop_codon:yes gene_type:complete